MTRNNDCYRQNIGVWRAWLLLCAVLAALPCTHTLAQDRVSKQEESMSTLVQLIESKRRVEARAYVSERQNTVIPEIRAIVMNVKMPARVRRSAFAYLQDIPTLESAISMAQMYKRGGLEAVHGLIANPHAEVYPILKSHLRPPALEEDKRLLLTMAQMPVPVEERLDDLWPYLDAKY